MGFAFEKNCYILWAGAMVIVVAFLYLSRFLGKVTCLQANAYGGICHACQNPNRLERVDGSPYKVAER